MEKPEFTYTEIDDNGLTTLKAIAKKDNFNDWIYQTVKPFLKEEILEIGSGIGNITACVINNQLSITASDIRKNYCTYLGEQFAGSPYLKAIRNINIVHPDFENEYKDLLNKFNSVFAINIIEHIEDDSTAIKNCKKLLQDGGHLIILVPAYPLLYNRFDKELKHFRRYSEPAFKELFRKANMEISHLQHFNCIGITGWWFSGSVLKRKTIPEGQMKIFNALVPVFKIADKIIANKLGLSIMGVGIK